jgi:chlorobactene glucosyltransferase
MSILLFFITGVLLIFLFTLAMNLLIFPKLKSRKLEQTPFVSLLIPARNEAAIIELTIQNILRQTYPNFELLILDDNSEDGTGAIVKTVNDNRLHLLKGSPLPENWLGKPWSCRQLAESAKGEILIFTDADVQWQPNALEILVAEMQSSGVDMLTVWPCQITETWPERLTVPLMAMVILAYLPTIMVHHSPFSIFAAANGQCMAWKREAYFGIGGHEIVAQNVLDDVTMARAAKAAGYRIRMVDGNEHIATRMYHDWPTVRDGYAKNMLAGYGSVPALVAATILHWLIFLLPYALLFSPDYRLWAGIIIIIGLALRAISAWFTHQRLWDALLMPLSVFIMTFITLRSLYWHYTGSARWKGRTLSKKDSQWQKVSS